MTKTLDVPVDERSTTPLLIKNSGVPVNESSVAPLLMENCGAPVDERPVEAAEQRALVWGPGNCSLYSDSGLATGHPGHCPGGGLLLFFLLVA